MAAAQTSVLVTGGAGFLGRHLVQRLRDGGKIVKAPTRAEGFDLMRDALDLEGVSRVYHLAGRTFVPSAWTEAAEFHRINAHGTVRVLDQCRLADCAMTYCSAYVYGAPDSLPIAETAPVRPNNPYAFSKYMGEEACRFYANMLGLDVTIARPFNIYGPGQSEEFIIPHIVNQVVDPACGEVAVRDLAPRRDFVHVEDAVSALIVIAGAPSGQVFNVGSGESISVADIIASAFAAAGAVKPIKSAAERRANEIDDVVADTSALRALGWTPRIDFSQGMRLLVEDAQGRLNARLAGSRYAKH